MRIQPVKRIVNALDGQDRFIVQLTCGHNLSVSRQEIDSDPKVLEYLRQAERSGSFGCWECPDPDPEEVRREKSATQLWREAGEP